MKKGLIFSTAYLPMIGGAEIAVKEITDRLGDDFAFSAQGGPAFGWEFDLICARIKKDLPKRESVGQINVYRLGWGCFLDKYYLALFGHRFAAKLHKKNNYDAIWAIMASFGGFAALFFKKENPLVPFLLTLQEGDPPEYIKKRVGIFDNWFAQIFTRADYIQAISNFLAGWAKDMGAKCPIEVVPNGVSISKFQDIRNNNQKLKDELNIKPDEKVIITVSRLVKKNGVEDLINGFSLLLANGHPLNAKLLIIGDGPLKNDLIRLGRIKLSSNILLLGSIPPDDVPRYLAISDVFIRPSLSEGLGSAFLEAMAAGVPIIGTRVGGIPDFLEDG
ncbi:MAG: glycosyltransferase family 4 protein, partial [Patescibacteria group bacterium]